MDYEGTETSMNQVGIEKINLYGCSLYLKQAELARARGKDPEQVVKNYLRKIYDKLQVLDRLELALYSMHHRLLEGYVPQSVRGGKGGGMLVSDTAVSPETVSTVSADASTPASTSKLPDPDQNN